MSSKRRPVYAANIDALAGAVGVSARCLRGWRSRYGSEFPAKEPEGWPVAKVRAFARRHHLGPYRSVSRVNGNGHKTLTEARRELTIEKTHRERLAKREDEIRLAIQEGQIVLADDVAVFHERVVGTALAALGELVDAHERELVGMDLSAELVERICDASERVVGQFRSIMQELLTSSEEMEE